MKVTYYRMRVKGRYQFPFDMLRYEQAWPLSTADALMLEPYERGEREVTLMACSVNPRWEPTYARWRSFGWTVIEGSVEKSL